MRKTAVVLLCGWLAGCGGGSGGGSDSNIPVGTYVGALSQGGATYDLQGVFLDNGPAYLFTIEGASIFVADFSADGDKLSADYDSYGGVVLSQYALGAVKAGGGTLDATQSAQGFAGTFRADDGTIGAVDLQRGTSNSQGGPISAVTGSWSVTDEIGTTNLVIQGSGAVTGSDSSGCQLSGTATPSPSGANAYRLSLTVTCPGQSAYTADGALARLNPLDGHDTIITIYQHGNAAAGSFMFRL